MKEEEFARAEALALFDDLRKSRSQGFTVSLSGGCDSSVVVTLVHWQKLLCSAFARAKTTTKVLQIWTRIRLTGRHTSHSAL